MQMDNLRCLLGIERRNRVSNARIRELIGVRKGVDERTDKSFHRWLGHIDRIANWVYMGECVGNRLVGRHRRRWVESVDEEKRFEC